MSYHDDAFSRAKQSGRPTSYDLKVEIASLEAKYDSVLAVLRGMAAALDHLRPQLREFINEQRITNERLTDIENRLDDIEGGP